MQIQWQKIRDRSRLNHLTPTHHTNSHDPQCAKNNQNGLTNQELHHYSSRDLIPFIEVPECDL